MEEKPAKYQLIKHSSNFNLAASPPPRCTCTCKLCLCDDIHTQDMMRIESCGCTFCYQCMQSYVETLISDRTVLAVTCPDMQCSKGGTLSDNEIDKLLPHEIFQKYQNLKFEQEVAADPNRAFCPKCSAVCRVRNSDETQAWDSFPVKCNPTCHHEFCSTCKSEWKAGHKCQTVTHSHGNGLLKFQAKIGLGGGVESVAIKRCPVCSILIEKDRGCAQMICKNCSHVFCWYCLKLLDNDFMLRHYDTGPCREMLGHSRAQVFRHRVGVVGLFAAFSLLVIVASPILLLATPVFLCCKCKEGCQQAINNINNRRESLELRRINNTNSNRDVVNHVQDDVIIAAPIEPTSVEIVNEITPEPSSSSATVTSPAADDAVMTSQLEAMTSSADAATA